MQNRDQIISSTLDSVNLINSFDEFVTQEEYDNINSNKQHLRDLDKTELPDSVISQINTALSKKFAVSNILTDDISTRMQNINYDLNNGGDLTDISNQYREVVIMEEKEKWRKARIEEYKSLFPETREMTEDEKAEYDAEHFSEEEPKPEGFEYPKVKIDYSDNPNYKTFEEWLNETKVVEDAVTDEDGNIIEPEKREKVREFTPKDYTDQVNEFLKPYRYKRLEEIFKEKTNGLKKLAIDKPWMTDTEAINDQYRVYEEMYKNALKGYYDDATNQAIIQANEAVKQALAPITLLLNEVRSVIEKTIEENPEKADDLFQKAASVSLKKENITPEIIEKIKKEFFA